MDSDGTCANSDISAASCKLVPLGRATFWMLKLVNFHRCPWCPWDINLFPLIPACTARPGLPLSPPETAFLESPYYRPQTASIDDRHHPTNFHSVTYTQTDDAAFEAGSDNDHKSFLRMRVIFKVEYPAELFRFRRVLDDILSSFDVF